MIYVYRCPLHGEFEAEYPLARNPQHATCPYTVRTIEVQPEGDVFHDTPCVALTSRVFTAVNLDGSAIPSRSPVAAHTGKRPGKLQIPHDALAAAGTSDTNRA